MKYTVEQSLQIISATPAILQSWLGNLDEEWIGANEGPDTWSAFDIVGHLIHGEKTDWIPRLRIILSDEENKTFEPFDRFAQEQESQGRSMRELLSEFSALRKKNVDILSSLNLNDDDLDKKGTHPEFGDVTARQLLSTWTVHDLAHLYQIARVMGHQYRDEVGPWRQYVRMIRS